LPTESCPSTKAKVEDSGIFGSFPGSVKARRSILTPSGTKLISNRAEPPILTEHGKVVGLFVPSPSLINGSYLNGVTLESMTKNFFPSLITVNVCPKNALVLAKTISHSLLSPIVQNP